MTESEAKGFVQGKLDCMEKCDVFNKEDKHRNNECELCDYCYSQGNFGEQKEAFSVAINALEEIQQYKALGTVEELRLVKEKQIPKNPIFQFNLSDTVSRFECDCGKIIKVRHDIGIMDNNDAPNYCDNCGQKLDWSDEE